jgi:hypothetical protein
MVTLIQQAIDRSPIFEEKMRYWIHGRKRVPELNWVLQHLVDILGEETVITRVEELSKLKSKEE